MTSFFIFSLTGLSNLFLLLFYGFIPNQQYLTVLCFISTFTIYFGCSTLSLYYSKISNLIALISISPLLYWQLIIIFKYFRTDKLVTAFFSLLFIFSIILIYSSFRFIKSSETTWVSKNKNLSSKNKLFLIFSLFTALLLFFI